MAARNFSHMYCIFLIDDYAKDGGKELFTYALHFLIDDYAKDSSEELFTKMHCGLIAIP